MSLFKKTEEYILIKLFDFILKRLTEYHNIPYEELIPDYEYCEECENRTDPDPEPRRNEGWD